MFRFWCLPRKLRLLALVGILASGIGLSVAGPCLAQSETSNNPHGPSNLVRVEEDWALLVTSPDFNKAAPQVTTQMVRSPDALRFCTFHLNSCSIPSYNQGGLQVQAWEGSTNLAVQTSQNRNTMATPNELVQWTQYLERAPDGTTLHFGICSASSDTWGDFSGGMVVFVPDSAVHLGNYSIEYSVGNSGITYGANRVSMLQLLQVRKTYADGFVETIYVTELPAYGIVYSQALDSGVSGGDY